MRLVKYTSIVLKEKLGKHSCLRIHRTVICVKCKKNEFRKAKFMDRVVITHHWQ
jgi:hypothetical protein